MHSQVIRGLLAVGLMLALAAPAVADTNEPEPIPLVVVHAEDDEQLQRIVAAGLDVVDVDTVNREVFVVAGDFEQAYFADHGLDYEVIDENVNVFPESPAFTPFTTERTTTATWRTIATSPRR